VSDTPSNPSTLAGSSNELPTPFGRYRLLKLLGAGGMGKVYLAHDTQLDRSVALKMPHLGVDESADSIARFYREARAAATIVHPNICPLYDIGEVEGKPYMTMACVNGSPLSTFAREHPLSPRQAAVLVRKIALALQEAHQQGVIHRDLKPGNIMIDQRGEPIIMDFGLARREVDPRMTQFGAVVGTPGYMAPEQANGEVNALGPACDIYSLGVILYKLLTDRLPFEGDTFSVLLQVVSAEAPPPSRFVPDIDPALEAICQKAMAKKPRDRYASMTDLANAMAGYLRAKTSPRLPRVPSVRKRPSRILPFFTGLAASTVVGLLLVLLWLGVRRSPKNNVVDDATPVPPVEAQSAGAKTRLAEERTSPAPPPSEKASVDLPPVTPSTAATPKDINLPPTKDPDASASMPPPKTAPAAVPTPVTVRDPNEPILHSRLPDFTIIETIDLSPSGDMLLVADRGTTNIYDVGNAAKPRWKFAGGYGGFIQGDKRIITCSGAAGSALIHLHNLESGEQKSFPLPGAMERLRLSPQGDRLEALISRGPKLDNVIALLDATNGSVIRAWPHNHTKSSALFSPDGKYLFLILGGHHRCSVYRTSTGADDETFARVAGITTLEGIFPDNRRVYGLADNVLHVYAANTARELLAMKLGISPVEGDNYARAGDLVVLSPDAHRLLTSHQDHKVRLWDLQTRKELGAFSFDEHILIKKLLFSADGRRACALGTKAWVYLWRLPQ
jgi:serine/threonine protein kinase